ncbi:hypothetical protein [Sphingomonas sp. PP-CE-1G-424]|uniref:hypothetical protein n=1 Tax=Sphingomonas sp. PP-CE-1G-424 TaxID=2135658 RepID=UPI0010547721|nr:hypothetical protein [Sphingomonas sp. PP-CE-1G-424]TCP66292.1 hypothetical protein C8J43_10512 [Sphingomonas sp. PP-CE-1G-424]
MASEWEDQVAGYFHAMRAKKKRRPHPGQERLNQAVIDRARRKQHRRNRRAALEVAAEIFDHERWWG